MTIFQRAWRLSVATGLLFGVAAAASRADDAAGPRLFDSPAAAVQALAEALTANDDDALNALVGPGNDDLVPSGKDSIVARERRRVATLVSEKVTFETLDDGTQVPVVGMRAWPMPIPLAPKDGKWFFDAEQGRDELLARRIGTNELRMMDLMRSVVEAQEAYKAQDRDGDGVLEYAQRFISTPGKHDGLFWVDLVDVSVEDRSPLGAMVEELAPYAEGTSKGAPFGGYVFKLVFSQDATARGGAQSFLDGENLTGGFVAVAVPAAYRGTGVMSFLITHRNRLMQRDLGPNGVELMRAATVFAPEAKWEPVDADAK